MQVNNLTKENVKEAETMFDKMKETNPDLRYKTYKQDNEERDLRTRVDELAEIIVNIEIMLKRIFGNYVLINGQFVDISQTDVSKKI